MQPDIVGTKPAPPDTADGTIQLSAPTEQAPPNALPKRISLAAIWAIAISGTLLLHYSLSDFAFEDAYITYRYATNVAEGAGYVFTPGERVFGASSPLHVMVLALFGALGGDIPYCSGVLFASCWGAVAVMGGYILRHLNSPIAGLLFTLMIVLGATEVYSYWGLETTMLTALIMASGLSVLKGRDSLAGVFAGLAFLTRYDAGLFAILLFCGLWVHRRRIPWRPGIIATLIVTPWLLFAWLYFGSVLPNTLGAKMGDSAVGHYLYKSAATQLSLVWEPLRTQRSIFLVHPTTHFWLNIGLGIGILLAVIFLLRKQVLLGIFLAYPLALWVGYAFIGPPLVFHWYLTPGVVSLLLVAFAGLGTLIPENRFQWPRLVAALALIGLAGSRLPDGLDRRSHHYMDNAMYRSRILAYSDIADWIIENDLSQLSLMANEPGYLVYKSRNPAIDSAGLVTKNVQFHGDKSKRTSLIQLVRERKPNLIVSRNVFRPRDYALVFSAFPGINLFLDPESHAKFFEQQTTRLLKVPAELELESLPHHPFHMDFDRASRSSWRDAGGVVGILGRDRALEVDGNPLSESVLMIDRALEGAQTPPFLIDFDRLSFRFAGSHSKGTVARLIIGGKVVLESLGRSPDGDKAADFPIHSWPVENWRGRVATIRFAIPFLHRQWLAADHIRSVQTTDSKVLDDFESEDGYGDRWLETFGSAPTPLHEIARLHGVEYTYSAKAATSRGLKGHQKMVSHPILVEHDLLNFLVLDFGIKGKAAVELLVEGQVVRSFHPIGGGRLNAVTWNVSDLRGQEVVLRASDSHKAASRWIGIDSITFTNE